MNTYRIAGIPVAYTAQTDYAAAFLSEYTIEADAQLNVVITPQDITVEQALLPTATHGIWEVSALLRKLARQMPAHDRLLLHAATIVVNNKAYAFVAPSGTGKTTHVRLWKEYFGDNARILNGDKLFVHIGQKELTAYGNPWRGKEHLGYNGEAPLDGLVVLTRGARSHCEPLAPTQALPSLLRATLCPSSQDERLAVLALLERLTQNVPLYHLQATPAVDAVDTVWKTLGGTL